MDAEKLEKLKRLQRKRNSATKNFHIYSQLDAVSSSNANSLNENKEEEIPIVETKKTAIVKCKIIFVRMGNINTKLERFDCQVYIECSWQDETLLQAIVNKLHSMKSNNDLYDRVMEQLQTISYDPKNFYDPNIYIENAIGDIKEEKSYRLQIIERDSIDETCLYSNALNPINIFQSKYTVMVSQMSFVKGVFHEVKKKH